MPQISPKTLHECCLVWIVGHVLRREDEFLSATCRLKLADPPFLEKIEGVLSTIHLPVNIRSLKSASSPSLTEKTSPEQLIQTHPVQTHLVLRHRTNEQEHQSTLLSLERSSDPAPWAAESSTSAKIKLEILAVPTTTSPNEISSIVCYASGRCFGIAQVQALGCLCSSSVLGFHVEGPTWHHYNYNDEPLHINCRSSMSAGHDVGKTFALSVGIAGGPGAVLALPAGAHPLNVHKLFYLCGYVQIVEIDRFEVHKKRIQPCP